MVLPVCILRVCNPSGVVVVVVDMSPIMLLGHDLHVPIIHEVCEIPVARRGMARRVPFLDLEQTENNRRSNTPWYVACFSSPHLQGAASIAVQMDINQNPAPSHAIAKYSVYM
jgi:hypothetical protein